MAILLKKFPFQLQPLSQESAQKYLTPDASCVSTAAGAIWTVREDRSVARWIGVAASV